MNKVWSRCRGVKQTKRKVSFEEERKHGTVVGGEKKDGTVGGEVKTKKMELPMNKKRRMEPLVGEKRKTDPLLERGKAWSHVAWDETKDRTVTGEEIRMVPLLVHTVVQEEKLDTKEKIHFVPLCRQVYRRTFGLSRGSGHPPSHESCWCVIPTKHPRHRGAI